MWRKSKIDQRLRHIPKAYLWAHYKLAMLWIDQVVQPSTLDVSFTIDLCTYPVHRTCALMQKHRWIFNYLYLWDMSVKYKTIVDITKYLWINTSTMTTRIQNKSSYHKFPKKSYWKKQSSQYPGVSKLILFWNYTERGCFLLRYQHIYHICNSEL